MNVAFELEDRRRETLGVDCKQDEGDPTLWHVTVSGPSTIRGIFDVAAKREDALEDLVRQQVRVREITARN